MLICGDYKTTINRYSKLDGYPLPKAEDLFTTRMGGQTIRYGNTPIYIQIHSDQLSDQ